jgi:hypothetical protein
MRNYNFPIPSAEPQLQQNQSNSLLNGSIVSTSLPNAPKHHILACSIDKSRDASSNFNPLNDQEDDLSLQLLNASINQAPVLAASASALDSLTCSKPSTGKYIGSNNGQIGSNFVPSKVFAASMADDYHANEETSVKLIDANKEGKLSQAIDGNNLKLLSCFFTH